MSNTFTAGQKMRAADMVPQKNWTVTATSNSSSVTTAEAVVYTTPSATYRAGRAYRLTFRGRWSATAALDVTMAVRDTNISGFIRMSGVVYRVPAATLAYGFHHEHIIANTGTSDVTSRVMVLTLVTSVNSVVIQASSVHPWYWECTEIGDADDFPEAVGF